MFHRGDRVFRTVTEAAAAEYEFVRDTGLLAALVEAGLALPAAPVGAEVLGPAAAGARHVLEQPKLAFISYPYEWPFEALKAAALAHLEVQLTALDQGVTLTDASAYNMQFDGPRPVFIDCLSFRRYRDGEFWTGHRQFCEQFLNPLLLRALVGVPHNGWYRGTQEGITAAELDRLLPLRRKLSWRVLTHVSLQSALQRAGDKDGAEAVARTARGRRLPRAAYRRMLERLHAWIARLRPADRGRTQWADYAASHNYDAQEAAAKKAFVAGFASEVKPRLLWDLGCNTGDYAKTALEAGAARAVGFDLDHGALDAAFLRARAEDLAFLPLLMDAANPSPNQGWAERERRGLRERAPADAVLALAFVHHLAIGRNVPLAEIATWLAELAPAGVVEFVPKSDPMVRRLLALREDIFADYGEETFVAALEKRARIVASETVTASGRRLIRFQRR